MKKVCFFVLLAMCSLTLLGRDVQIIKLTNQTPLLDGKLNDACWQQGNWNSGFFILGPEKKMAKQQTCFKAAANENGVYFAIRCQDSEVKSETRAHDSGFSRYDCLEFFIVPDKEIPDDPNIRTYYHFLVNASGSRAEIFSRGGVGNVKWNCLWDAKTQKTSTGWDAEIFIPFCAFQKPSSGTWRFNIGRGNPGVEFTALVPSVSYRDLKNFANLNGIQLDQKRFSTKITDLKFEPAFVKGKLQIAVTGNFSGIPEKKIMVNCIISNEKNMFTANTVLSTPDGKDIRFRIPGELQLSGRYRIQLIGQDSQGISFYLEQEKELNLAPVSIRMHKRYRPWLILSQYPDKKVSFDCVFLLDSAVLQRSSAELTVKDKNGKLMFSRKINKPASKEVFSFDAEKYAPGKYAVTVSVAENGRSLGAFRQTLTVAEPSKNEVWIDENGNLVINSKKVFPVGFMGFGCDISVFEGSGCNVMHSYAIHFQKPEKLRETLDLFYKNNIRLMILPYPRYENAHLMKKGLTQEQWQKTEEHIRKLRHHPAILGWAIFDEPRSPEWIETLRILRSRLEEWDPTHPVFGNDDTAAGCIGLDGASDVIMLDMYPNPVRGGGNLKSLLSIYNSMKQIRKESAVPAIWNVPQAYVFYPHKTNNRTPTFPEVRCAVYCAVAGGANGILPYQTGNPMRKNGMHTSPDMRLGYLKAVCPELAQLEPVLTAETVNGMISADNSDLILLVKRYKEKLTVIAVNPHPRSLGKVVLNNMPPGKWKVLSEQRTVSTSGSKLTDDFGKKAVHIYMQDLNYPDRIDLKKVQTQIDEENQKTRE